MKIGIVGERKYQDRQSVIDLFHAFISQEDGFVGGTRFEVEYALKLRKPVHAHWENGKAETFYHYYLTVMDREHAFF